MVDFHVHYIGLGFQDGTRTEDGDVGEAISASTTRVCDRTQTQRQTPNGTGERNRTFPPGLHSCDDRFGFYYRVVIISLV